MHCLTADERVWRQLCCCKYLNKRTRVANTRKWEFRKGFKGSAIPTFFLRSIRRQLIVKKYELVIEFKSHVIGMLISFLLGHVIIEAKVGLWLNRLGWFKFNLDSVSFSIVEWLFFSVNKSIENLFKVKHTFYWRVKGYSKYWSKHLKNLSQKLSYEHWSIWQKYHLSHLCVILRYILFIKYTKALFPYFIFNKCI
jgi:hypothetical protein